MMANRRISVVLADDHRVVRRGICGFLNEDPGIEVIAEAEDGDQALALIEQHCPDVAVLDLKMPGCTGIDIAQRVRERQLPVNIVILTAYDDEPYLVAALEAGVNGYILKCSDAEQIVHAVHTVARGGSVLDSHIVPSLMKILANPPKLHPSDELSEREVDVLRYAAEGLTNRGIAERMGISHRTVQGHLRRIFEKLGVCNRTEAVVKASHMNLISLPEQV